MGFVDAFRRLDDRMATDNSLKPWFIGIFVAAFVVPVVVMTVIYGTAKPFLASLPLLTGSLLGTR